MEINEQIVGSEHMERWREVMEEFKRQVLGSGEEYVRHEFATYYALDIHIIGDIIDGVEREHLDRHLGEFKEMVDFLESVNYEYLQIWKDMLAESTRSVNGGYEYLKRKWKCWMPAVKYQTSELNAEKQKMPRYNAFYIVRDKEGNRVAEIYRMSRGDDWSICKDYHLAEVPVEYLQLNYLERFDYSPVHNNGVKEKNRDGSWSYEGHRTRCVGDAYYNENFRFTIGGANHNSMYVRKSIGGFGSVMAAMEVINRF